MFYGCNWFQFLERKVIKFRSCFSQLRKNLSNGKEGIFKLIKESAAQMYPDSSVTFCLSNVVCAFPKVVTHGQYGTRYSNAGHVLQVSLENAYLL